ncbi:MAG: hypothetical protein MUO40_04035 [Anaerolineaceae bacterium]|nr:hypothetical protein [Anaerolineaceae bacterium]
MNYLQPILINLATQLPILIAFIVGIIIAIVTWKRNPKPSLLALIALIILGLLTVIGSAANFLTFILRDEFGMALSQVYPITTAVFIILTILRGGAYGLLIGAVFSKRKKPVEVEQVV